VSPDVAVIHAGSPLGLADGFTAASVPRVVYLRDTRFDSLGAVHDRRDVRYVTTSGDLANRFAAAFGIAPVSIPPVIRPERYEVEPLRRNVTFVCPIPQKGLEVALGLAARRRDVPFVFVESWPLRSEYRRALKHRIGAAANITLRRWALDMRPVYREAKLVLVPSQLPRAEGWGRVVSEAQVSGIPVLASRLGGLPEAVGPGGILVDADADLSAWEAALARMWDDPAEYARLAGLAGQHARRPEFQPSALTERLLTVLADVVHAAGTRPH
jgi:glycosyltransferase involved in cell wall biosynthesis